MALESPRKLDHDSDDESLPAQKDGKPGDKGWKDRARLVREEQAGIFADGVSRYTVAKWMFLTVLLEVIFYLWLLQYRRANTSIDTSLPLIMLGLVIVVLFNLFAGIGVWRRQPRRLRYGLMATAGALVILAIPTYVLVKMQLCEKDACKIQDYPIEGRGVDESHAPHTPEMWKQCEMLGKLKRHFGLTFFFLGEDPYAFNVHPTIYDPKHPDERTVSGSNALRAVTFGGITLRKQKNVKLMKVKPVPKYYTSCDKVPGEELFLSGWPEQEWGPWRETYCPESVHHGQTSLAETERKTSLAETEVTVTGTTVHLPPNVSAEAPLPEGLSAGSQRRAIVRDHVLEYPSPFKAREQPALAETRAAVEPEPNRTREGLGGNNIPEEHRQTSEQHALAEKAGLLDDGGARAPPPVLGGSTAPPARADVSHVASMVTEGIGSLGNKTRSVQTDLNKLLEEEKELKAEVQGLARTARGGSAASHRREAGQAEIDAVLDRSEQRLSGRGRAERSVRFSPQVSPGGEDGPPPPPPLPGGGGGGAPPVVPRSAPRERSAPSAVPARRSADPPISPVGETPGEELTEEELHEKCRCDHHGCRMALGDLNDANFAHQRDRFWCSLDGDAAKACVDYYKLVKNHPTHAVDVPGSPTWPIFQTIDEKNTSHTTYWTHGLCEKARPRDDESVDENAVKRDSGPKLSYSEELVEKKLCRCMYKSESPNELHPCMDYPWMEDMGHNYKPEYFFGYSNGCRVSEDAPCYFKAVAKHKQTHEHLYYSFEPCNEWQRGSNNEIVEKLEGWCQNYKILTIVGFCLCAVVHITSILAGAIFLGNSCADPVGTTFTSFDSWADDKLDFDGDAWSDPWTESDEG